MMRPVQTLSTILLLAAVVGCGHPDPGPNALAGPAAAPDTPLASRPTLGDEAGAVARNRVEVPFTQGNTALTPDAQHSLDVAARLFRDARPVRMFVAGHSDGAGDEYANLLLSAQRAQVVKRGLVARGIPASRLLIQAYGVSEPTDAQDPTAPSNRRVEITWRLL